MGQTYCVYTNDPLAQNEFYEPVYSHLGQDQFKAENATGFGW